MLQLFKVNGLGPKKSICYQKKKEKGQLNANRSPPHSFARQKTGLEAKTEGAIDKTADFAKRSFRQEVRTNQRGNENGGAQAGKRPCRA